MSLPNVPIVPNPMFDPETTGQIPAVRPLSPGEMLAREALGEPEVELYTHDEAAQPVRPLLPTELPDLHDEHERPGDTPTLDDLAGDWFARYRTSSTPAAPVDLSSPATAAVVTPRLRTWTLPNGRFVVVLDRCADLEDGAHEMLRDRLAESTGAASTLVFADEVEVVDADVLVDDVPPGVRAEDERLVQHLREFASVDLARMRADADTMRAEAVRLRAEHEAASRDLAEALSKMSSARELARAHGQAAIVAALALDEDDEPGAVAA